MAERNLELLQFRFSPYNEKARWALDYKGMAHGRVDLLPGPHMPRVRKLTGQTATPVLKIGNEVVWGSARIIDTLERLQPMPALHPTDPTARDAALAIQERFDEDWGPRLRRAALAAMIGDSGYLCRTFGQGQPVVAKAVYRLVLPLAKGMIAKGNGIRGPESILVGDRAVAEALDFVAETSAETGYLVGGTFSVADLAAAAMLAPAVNPPHPDMAKPEPKSPGLARWLARWADHPGAHWVREMYRRHRGSAVAGAGATG